MSEITFVKYIVILINLFGSIETWTPDIKPKISLNTELKNVPSFFGNSSDYFKILNQDDTSILIGARNYIFYLNLDGLREKYRIEWYSSDADRELCALKGKSEKDCQNYIRVFARTSSTQIMICGTNSYKPRCRFYSYKYNQNTISNISDIKSENYNYNNSSKYNNQSSNDQKFNKIQMSLFTQNIPLSKESIHENSNRIDLINKTQIMVDKDKQFNLINEIEAQGRCPYNPQHNSTYIYTDGHLYSATVADFSGADPLIYREALRTEQYDLKQLNQPAFVSALERNGYVFFFFREIAMEYMNCGKTVYSRVGRVCKNDRGGPYAFSDRWTSFLKTRLNCSVPGEYPFYFDEIQSTSQIIDGFYPLYGGSEFGVKNSIIYAVFTTPVNAIPGSAICAFSVDDILETFEGRFKYQKDSNSNWLPLSKDNVPKPRPGQCVDDSRTLTSTSVNFVKTHSLMEASVAPLYDKPILTRVSLNYRLTAITVDSQIQTIDNNTYDVIFVGTDNGKVIKFMNIIGLNNEVQTIVIAEMDALPNNAPIREMSISLKTQSLIVVGDGYIVSLPLHYCSHITYCWDCLNLQDPYCAWDISNFECKSVTSIQFRLKDLNIKNYIQTLNSSENTKNICKRYGGHNNVQNGKKNQFSSSPKIVSTGSRGIVTPTGKSLNNLDGLENIDGDKIENVEDQISSIYTNYKDSTLPGNDVKELNKISLSSLNPEHIGIPFLSDNNVNIEGKELKYASSNISWSVIVVITVIIVFTIGIFVGWHASRRLCKNSAFHTEHRNQLNPKGKPIIYRNSSKDVNLLMNTSNPFSQPCNNKKDNIEHEFDNEKDRSHECKNSTENLEKDVNFSKTGTLTKVKRTYI